MPRSRTIDEVNLPARLASRFSSRRRSARLRIMERVIRVFPSHDAADRADHDELSAMSPQERLDRALALRPDSSEAWRYRGSTLITLNRDEEALAAFESALARNPMEASAQAGIGRVHFILRGDFARAALAYERALDLNPRAGWSALQLAHCATLLRDFPRGRVGGPPRDRAAAGVSLRSGGDGAGGRPHAPRPRARPAGAAP